MSDIVKDESKVAKRKKLVKNSFISGLVIAGITMAYTMIPQLGEGLRIGVDKYCEASLDKRDGLVEEINKDLVPHSIAITCGEIPEPIEGEVISESILDNTVPH